MRRRHIVLAALLALTLAGVAAAQGRGLINMFSQRLVVRQGSPLVDFEGYQPLPGPVVGFFIQDERNRATCVLLLKNLTTGETWPMGAVDARSCGV